MESAASRQNLRTDGALGALRGASLGEVVRGCFLRREGRTGCCTGCRSGSQRHLLHPLPPALSPQNLNQNPRTLLPKFYGLYCVQSGGKNIRVVVMNNVLPRVVKMHLKFDLKGSTYKRRASKKEKEKSIPTYKDLDFIQDMPEGLMLDADTFSALVKTLQRDCLVRRRLDRWGCVPPSLSHSFPTCQGYS